MINVSYWHCSSSWGSYLLKMTWIYLIFNWRSPGYFGHSQILPIHLLKPRMPLDIFSVVLYSKSHFRVGVQKLQYQMSCSQTKKWWKFNYSFHYFPVNVIWLVVIVKWWVSSQQLINQYSDSPVVYSLVIAGLIVFVQHLRGQILRSTTNGKCPAIGD